MVKKRFEEIDILKALGIICVVLGHSGAPGTKFLYLFHMPIFFMASGYVYSDKHSQTLGALFKNAKSKLLRLWLPYFFFNTLFVLMNNVFLDLNVYTDDPRLFDYVSETTRGNLSVLSHYQGLRELWYDVKMSAIFATPTIMGGAMWFFGTLFYISIFYPIVDWVLRKCLRRDPWLLQTILSVALLCVGDHYGREGFLFYGANRVCSCYILYHLGYSLKKFNVHTLLKTKLHNFFLGAGSLAMLIVMYALQPGYSIDLWKNHYADPVFLVMAAVAGWGFVYTLAYFLKDTFLKKPLIHIGNRTMSITILHYGYFKLVAYLVIKVYDLPIFCLAAHSHLYGDRGLWWLAYTVVGLVGPVIAYDLYKKSTEPAQHHKLEA